MLSPSTFSDAPLEIMLSELYPSEFQFPELLELDESELEEHVVGFDAS